MKILHTSDWHLGRTLYGEKRYSEHQAFLTWLIQLIEQEHIELLLLSGDVFDTTTPSNQAQSLYYQFLHYLPRYCQAVIIAGNHDSPTFLNASRELLAHFNVFVIGHITNQPKDEVLLLKDAQKQPKVIVCAIPYLRDKDVRHLQSGESIHDKNQQLLHGIKQHHQQVFKHALDLKKQIQQDKAITVPIIGMGHLFTSGAKTIDGDGVRDLYVGSLNHIHADIFPNYLDYVALGHLHIPQTVAGKEYIRYSGSPIPIGFSECQQKKQVILLSFIPERSITPINIPCFQTLIQLKGDLPKIAQQLESLQAKDSQAWLEIEYTGTEKKPNLREEIEQCLQNSKLKVLKIKNNLLYRQIINTVEEKKTLQDLDPMQLFKHYLATNEIDATQQALLISAYSEILQSLYHSDPNAE